MLTQVVKRDNTVKDFDPQKISEAVGKAGLREEDRDDIIKEVLRSIGDLRVATVEQIQDQVEAGLMSLGHTEIARKYILYREERRKLREVRLTPDPTAISNYTHFGKYSRFSELLMRRETWEESVERLMSMHLARWPEYEKEIRAAFSFVTDKKVLPSMRSLQFGGEAIEQINARLYNCSFSLIDRPEFFHHMFYLLLAGCGVGFSVQQQHVSKLPWLKEEIDRSDPYFFKPEDSIEGWAECLKQLIYSYMIEDFEHYGRYIEFDFSSIRPRGKKLKTSGGTAPGHVPLKILLEQVRSILDQARGRRLKPIECHDICCFVAAGVLSGGIRRSSLISLFDSSDVEMMNAKTGNWLKENPQRRLSNNSVVLIRGDYHHNKRTLDHVFEAIKQFGEPGFLFVTNPDYGCNPCAEIGLNPIDPNTGKTGFAFCNLTEINAAILETKEDFVKAARMAARIGTLQAAYTNFDYLGETTRAIAEREALLGVSITGMLDNPLATEPEVQQAMLMAVKRENVRMAKKLGIRKAARLTTVKPSGTACLVLGCVGSGHHPHHARRYIRRVTANKMEPVYNYFKSINPHMCVDSVYNNDDAVIEFPVQAPDNAYLKSDFSAIEFMDKIFSTYENWVKDGTVDIMSSPGLTHNISSTITVKENEWEEVKNYVWENRFRISAMSFLPASGDKDYPQAPREEISTKADEARWNEILENYVPVDYTLMNEEEDTTDPRGVSGCEGMSCEIIRR